MHRVATPTTHLPQDALRLREALSPLTMPTSLVKSGSRIQRILLQHSLSALHAAMFQRNHAWSHLSRYIIPGQPAARSWHSLPLKRFVGTSYSLFTIAHVDTRLSAMP